MHTPIILKYCLHDDFPAQEMVRLSAGRFLRRNEVGEAVGEVEVSDFTMGRYTVTYEQYIYFAKATGRRVPGSCGWGKGKRPVIKVSWFDATAYAQWLSAVTAEEFRLPTEAEWEYACRAGTKTDYYFGETITEQQVNFNRRINKTQPVGSYPANPFGLYDMHGNVWEWCSDWYGNYPAGNVKDPKGPNNGKYHVLRGGSWFVKARFIFSYSRACDEPTARDHSRGFRLAGG